MKNTFPSKHNLSVLRRHLHIVALLLNDKESWNAETLASFLSAESDSDSGIDGKTIRVDLKKHIQQTLGIAIATKKGVRRALLDTVINKEEILNLLILYSNFVVYDSSRTIAFNKLIDRQDNLSLWLLTNIHFAALTKKKIQFNYTANDMKIRDVKMNPYYVINQNSTLYLIGKRDKDNTVGPYIFDRIENLKILDVHYDDEIPSPEELFRHSHGVFVWNWSDATEVIIRYKKSRENNMFDEFSHLEPEIKRYADYFEMSFLVFDYESVCRQLFYYGSDVEILSPPEVREHMTHMLQKSLSVYKRKL